MRDDDPVMVDRAKTWERTPHGQKVICPDCGQTGYPWGSWLNKHRHHTDCDVCGKTVTVRGLNNHKRMHRPGRPTVIPDCANCVYSRPTMSDLEHEGPLLKCHRYPPTTFVLHAEVVQAHPDASEWCGEWRPSP